MDSQHRHQLQQNDLGQLALKAKPWLEQHGTKLVAGVVAVIVVIVGLSVWMNIRTASQAESWTKLSTARTVDEYGKVADEFPNTLAGVWARLRMGEMSLESGVAALFTDRALGLTDLETARKEFESVLSASVDLPDNVRERAMYGLAATLEALCDGETGPVIDAYQALLTRFPNAVFKTQVEERIKQLEKPAAREFYAWFHKQSPKPPELPRPQDGLKPGTSTVPDGDPFALPPAATTTPNPDGKPDVADPPADNDSN
jgi:hypothetical protein